MGGAFRTAQMPISRASAKRRSTEASGVAALTGPLVAIHVATLPFNVIKQILKHPLTDIGLENFLADWHKTRQRI